MNYRHAYHAGNFADAFKHIILIALLESLQHKETGFCYLETHAGAGQYDLFSEATQKSKEYENGIEKIFKQNSNSPIIQKYLEYIRKINSSEALRYYPGSPLFAKQLLRPQDRMVLTELHPEEFTALKKLFYNDPQIAVHQQDGYQALKAYLPPKERRGLVLIDPPYEKPDELKNLPNLLQQTLKRWETGVYAIWYPIKTRRLVENFYNDLKSKISQPIAMTELIIYPKEIDTHLNGCGMIIINPPWKLTEQLKVIEKELKILKILG